MNLVAPTDSFETATGVIESGADEIDIGLENENFLNLNLSERGRGCNVPPISELKGIVEFSHENRVLVDYTVNTPFLSDELEEMFISHVVSGHKIPGGMMSVGRCQVAWLSEKFTNPLIHVPAHVRTCACPKPLCKLASIMMVVSGKGQYIGYQKGSIHRLLSFADLGSIHRTPF